MSKYHKTVTRRDFMKGLGLAGAGLGAAAATVPVFHDLDELVSTAAYDTDNINQRPWYVKTRDFKDPNPEIDWSIVEPAGSCVMYRGGWPDYPNIDEMMAVGQSKLENTYWATRAAGLAANRPGYQLKDFAVDRAMRFNRGGNRLDKSKLPWDGSDPEGNSFHTQGGPQYQEIGEKEWQGTPEENLKMWRAAMHLFGSATVGVIDIDSDFKKMFVLGSEFWTDEPKGYQVGGKSYYPNSCTTYAGYSVQEKDEYLLYGAGPLGLSATMGYYNGAVLQYRAQRFLTLLGYQAYYTTTASNVGNASLCGVAELGRHNMMITPDFGCGLRLFAGCVTDLPIAPTKPIDFGVWKFCETCFKCADACEEYNAGNGPFPLTRAEPSWDVSGPWNRVGVKKYQATWPYCHHCGGFCRPSCVFGTQDQSSIHGIVKAVVSTTSIFNGFFRQMDDLFGFETVRSDKHCEDWWKRDLKTWPHDTILG